MLSNHLANFFNVEIRNEREGGVSPSTLGTALDSLNQLPNSIIAGWSDIDEGDEDWEQQVNVVYTEIMDLIAVWGDDYLLTDLLSEDREEKDLEEYRTQKRCSD